MSEWSEAYQEGYAAGKEFHLYGRERANNPYQGDEYYEWERGFRQAGQDS